MTDMRNEQQIKKSKRSCYGQEVVWIHSNWDQFVVLYGTNPKRI